MYFFLTFGLVSPKLQNRLGAAQDEKISQIYKHYHRDQRKYEYDWKVSLKFANLIFSAVSKTIWQGEAPGNPFTAILFTWRSFPEIWQT